MAKRKRASARPSKLRASARPSEKRASARKKAIPTPTLPLSAGGSGEAAPRRKPGPKPGTPSWRRFKYSPELLADCRRRYEETPETDVSIARQYGISDTTVRRLAQDHGWIKFPVSRIDLPAAMKLRQRAAALAQAQAFDRHPEERAQRASKGDGPGLSSFEGGLWPPPQDDGKSLPPTPDPSPPFAARMGGGEQNVARAEQEQQAPAQAEPPRAELPQAGPAREQAALAAAIGELLPGLQQVLAEVRAMRAGTAAPRTPLDLQRLAQTYASLNATLQDLQRMQERAQPQQRTGYYDDDMPADLDEFRNELARRIRAFFAARRGGGDAGGDAAAPVAASGA